MVLTQVHFTQHLDCRTQKVCTQRCFGLIERAFKYHAVSSLEEVKRVCESGPVDMEGGWDIIYFNQ